MFGLMEITGQLDEATKLAIIPTVVLPFTIIGMILTSVATWLAALFGFELKAEGPKRLFEVLMKPKVLALALVSNLIVYGAIKGAQHLSNGPYPLWWVQLQNASPQPSDRNYEHTNQPSLATTATAVTSSNDLEVVWELPLKSVVFGLPLVTGDSLFAGLEKGRLIEVDLKSGQLLRKFEIGQPVMASPVIANNKIYVGEGIHLTYNARIYSFDLTSGAFVGAFQTAGHIERAAVYTKTPDQSLLLFPAGKDGLYAINPETMQKVWQAPFGHFDTFPAVDDEQAYIGSGLEAGFEEAPTKAFAINLQTGKVVWEKPLPTSVWGIPVLWNNVVCLPTGDVYKNLKFGQLSCYEKASGKDYCIFNTTGSLISQPIVRGDHLVVSDIYGKIYQFNLKTRQLEWTLQVPTKGLSYASVSIDSQDRILLPGEEGLYVYSRANQALLSVWKPEGKWPGTFNNIVAYKDLMILADQAGVLRALRFKN
ncbi:PQQ-binding-like beta-propeller repeat protein [Bdellovibrio bacteriovorus]|uniref:outer membrane protein assembly factor BamB family protein n=1 Tax=Bdellovibrio bacteriovorus TaxID=959 RepID=UPI0035A67F87